MKILTLNAPNVPYTDKDILMPQVDLLQEAGLLKKLGHDVSFYDMDAKRATEEDLFSKIKGVDVIYMLFDEVVQIHSHSALDNAMKLGQKARDYGIKVIMGGTIPSFFYQHILQKDYADGVLIGPPGPALKELFSSQQFDVKGKTRTAYKKEGKISQINISDPKLLRGISLDDDYGLAARHLVSEEDYPIDVRAVAGSRGCRPKNKGCKFCPYTAFWGKHRQFSPEKTLKDIEQIIEKGHKKIMFLDSSFTYNPQNTRLIAEGIIEREYHDHLIWGGMSRVDMDFRILDIMQKAGLGFIHYGVESGDQNTIDNARKGITIAQIRRAFQEAKQRGLRTRASVIMDLGSTKDSVDRTIDLLVELMPNEIKPHFLSPRVYSDLDTAVTWEKQSIFGANAVIEGEIKEYAQQRLEDMAKYFKERRYSIILQSAAEPGFWKELWARGEQGEECNFVSIAPARYGISWRKK